jgi:tetratricopeptide (TPR) repeat protein
MRHGLAKGVIVVALALPLGACQVFHGIHFAQIISIGKRNHAPAPALAAGSSTEAGRAQLADGRPGLAIASFQRALTNGEQVAPALNGLGVAYARLDRDDLAERFFREAMAVDPANSRYSENLALLMRSPSFIARSAATAEQASEDSAALPNGTANETQKAKREDATPGVLHRISRTMVRIITAPLQAAPLKSAMVRVANRSKPPVHVALASKEPESSRPPVRLDMPMAPATDSGAGAAR